MKKIFLTCLLLSQCLFGAAQIKFENGYFIGNDGEKTVCLIKNVDWKDNPGQFEFKLSETANIQTGDIQEVKEFGIGDHTKYQRFHVQIDRSSDRIGQLSKDRDPSFNPETLFLKVVIEGKAALYSYVDGNLVRYFFVTDNVGVRQLVYKKYQVGEVRTATNDYYRLQLIQQLDCNNQFTTRIKNLTYGAKSLAKLFSDYNRCMNAPFTSYIEKKSKFPVGLSIRPGLSNSSLSIKNDISNFRDTDFGSELAFRIGAEIEFLLPFNKNKWSIFLEPTYQSFNSQATLIDEIGPIVNIQTVTASYSSLEIPFGVRYYMFLTDRSKFFVNSAVLFDIPFDRNIDFEFSLEGLDLNSTFNLALGLGYNYGKRFSVEIRVGTSREVLNSYSFWSSNYYTQSLILGFRLF